MGRRTSPTVGCEHKSSLAICFAGIDLGALCRFLQDTRPSASVRDSRPMSNGPPDLDVDFNAWHGLHCALCLTHGDASIKVLVLADDERVLGYCRRQASQCMGEAAA